MEPKHALWLVIFLSGLRYLIYAGTAFWIFYVWKRNKYAPRKIQQRFPGKKAVRSEILYSGSTVLIFGAVIYTVLFSPLRSFTRIYPDIHRYSLWYLAASVVLALIFHDTYFYWTHRFMHLKKVFPYVHHIHHKSHNPTPWAAYAFHPLEALVEIGVLPLLVCLIPLHPLALSLFGLYMICMNVMGHLGYELYPRGFMTGRWKFILNTSTHHNMHHHYGKCNYGLYFNVWDRVMHTNHVSYEETFINLTT